MAIVTFDTLKFVERLRAAGVPDAQAKAEAEGWADALSESTSDTLATKQDMTELRMELRELKVDFVKWMTGALIAQVAVVGAGFPDTHGANPICILYSLSWGSVSR